MRNILVKLSVWCWGLMLLYAGGPARAAEAPNALPLPGKVPALFAPSGYEALVRPFFARHCTSCHGPDKQEGKLRLDTLVANFTTSESAQHWIEVMDRLNLGEMPPDGQPRPAAEQARAVAGWVAAELRHAARLSLSHGGRVVLRRMNRLEYANTIRDLLSLRFLPKESPLEYLPPDGTAEGFDKVGSALMLDPSLLEKYIEVATLVARRAIITGPPEVATRKTRLEFEDQAKSPAAAFVCNQVHVECREHDVVLFAGVARSFGEFQDRQTKLMIPAKGLYAVRVCAAAEQAGRDEPVRMTVHRGDDVFLETDVTAPLEQPQVFEVVVPLDPAGAQELGVRLLNGAELFHYNPAWGHMDRAIIAATERKDEAEALRLRGRMHSEGLTSAGKPNPATLDHAKLPKLYLDWIELEGPLYDQWPPRSHTTLFFKGPEAAPDLAYAREMFARFLPRAWRRPVQPAEVEPIVQLVQKELDHGLRYEEAIRVGLVVALASPKFLYLVEPAGEQSQPLNDFELASRLSYFLWSSMPDDTLFDLAGSGKLHDLSVLEAQVDRLLADPKSKSLVEGFAAQWLKTGEFCNFTPDRRIYPDYDARLGQAMVQETTEFFAEILHHDRSILDFLDSDWTMLNGRLAKFYGIPGVKGDGFRRVSLPADAHRGGLLGHAGVMLRGSDGTRTKPVRRGVYVREVLFNDPPDPPPPNAGEIEPNIQGKNLTVRQRLLAHQQIASCASCHRTIDPYGLALENYDATGAWRTRQNGEGFRGPNGPPIDASGRLPNGQEFDGPERFKRLLCEQKDRFVQGLAEKMLTYALGRPVEPADRAAIQGVAERTAKEGYTLRAMMKAIVGSDAFLRK